MPTETREEPGRAYTDDPASLNRVYTAIYRPSTGEHEPARRSCFQPFQKEAAMKPSLSLATAVTALALAAPAAVAAPADPHAVPHLTAIEAQTLASRGVGAPNPSPATANVYVPPAAAFTNTVVPAAPRVQSTDDGFDWGSAGIGASAAGALVLIAVGGFGAAYRTRMRVAR
jgi:hypothetical protein